MHSDPAVWPNGILSPTHCQLLLILSPEGWAEEAGKTVLSRTGKKVCLLLLIKAYWEWIQLRRGLLRKKLLFQLLSWARPDHDITWCSALCLGSLPCAYFCSSSPSAEWIGMTGNEWPWRSSRKRKIFTFPQRCYIPFYCLATLPLGLKSLPNEWTLLT